MNSSLRMDAVSLEVERAFSGRRAQIQAKKATGVRDMEAWRRTRKEKDAEVGKILGPALPADRVTSAIDDLIGVYRRERLPGERFLDTYRRTGVAPFKEAVYVAAH